MSFETRRLGERRLFWRTRCCLLVVAALSHCKQPADPPVPAVATTVVAGGALRSDPSSSQEFQQAHEREYAKGKMTAFTALSSHYIDAGKSLYLSVGSDAVVVVSEGQSDDRTLHFEVVGSDLFCRQGCGSHPGSVARYVTWDKGRFGIGASPQSGGGRVIVYDSQHPSRLAFDGLKWFSVDPSWAVHAKFEAIAHPTQVKLTTSRGRTKEPWKVGHLSFRRDDTTHRLEALSFSKSLLQAADKKIGALFLAFSDATTGKASYDVGRYIDLEATLVDGRFVDQELVLDFNRATNPLCAYSDHFNCPFPPKANQLDIAVRAGEKRFTQDH